MTSNLSVLRKKFYPLNHFGRNAFNCQTRADGTSLPHWLTAALVIPNSSANALADPASLIAFSLSIF
jgi:hypothetical protein